MTALLALVSAPARVLRAEPGRLPRQLSRSATSSDAGRGDVSRRAAGDRCEVVMSRTSPGRYAIHEFARNVYDVQIDDGAGAPLGVERPNPSQWSVAGHSGTVRVRYKVFGDHLNGTHLAIDSTHAHMNIPAVAHVGARIREPPGAHHLRRARRVEGCDPAASHDRSANVHRRQPAIPDRQPDRAQRVYASDVHGRSRVSRGGASRRQRCRCRPVRRGPRENRARGARRVRRAAGVRGAVHVHR